MDVSKQLADESKRIFTNLPDWLKLITNIPYKLFLELYGKSWKFEAGCCQIEIQIVNPKRV